MSLQRTPTSQLTGSQLMHYSNLRRIPKHMKKICIVSYLRLQASVATLMFNAKCE